MTIKNVFLIQMNEITAFIDGGLTYGVNKAWADGLRLLKKECPERLNDNSILGGDDSAEVSLSLYPVQC